MEGPRIPQESELGSIHRFLNEQLRPTADWSIANEYPTALGRSNIHNMRMITEGEQIISYALLKPMIVRTPHVILKVGAIGSVVTEGQHRGRGYSTQIISACLEEARLQSCDIAVLWTGLHDFYRKLGFELAGYEESFIINQPLQVPPAQLTYKKSTQIAAEAILRLYQQHTVQTHRSLEDIQKYLRIPNANVYTAWGPNGKLEAFAVEGKGADLPNYIHEWAGSLPALLSLFNFILGDKGQEFVVMAPRHSLQLIKALRTQNVPQHEGFLGMIRVLNQSQIRAKVERAFKNVGQEAPELRDLNERDLVRFLFGPWDGEIQNQLQALGQEQDILPLRFWLWGWDSV